MNKVYTSRNCVQKVHLVRVDVLEKLLKAVSGNVKWKYGLLLPNKLALRIAMT